MKPRLTREGKETLAEDLDNLDARSDRDLRDSWQSLFGTEPPKRIDRSLLIQGIGYRMQENALGVLKPSTRRLLERAAETVAKRGKVLSVSNRATKPGTILAR